MSYQLPTAELDPILATLERHFEEARPRPLQLIASKLLLVSTFGLVLTYLFYLTTGAALISMAMLWVGLQILFALLSWRYLPVVKRQRRLYRDLDLISPDPTPDAIWKRRTPQQQRVVRVAVGVTLVVILGSIVVNRDHLRLLELPPLIGMLVLICGSAGCVWSDRKISLETAERILVWIHYALLIWVAVLVFLIWQGLSFEDWFGTLLAVIWPAWLLVKSRQVARIQERFAPLQEAGVLHDSLARRRDQAKQEGSGVVALEPEDVSRLAYAEREMIRQDRVDAIGKTKSEEEPWGVFIADVVHQQLRELGAEERLKVHNAISNLATPGAASGASSDSWRTLDVAGTPFSVRYRLAEEKRRVTVVELVSSEAFSDG